METTQCLAGQVSRLDSLNSISHEFLRRILPPDRRKVFHDLSVSPPCVPDVASVDSSTKRTVACAHGGRVHAPSEPDYLALRGEDGR